MLSVIASVLAAALQLHKKYKKALFEALDAMTGHGLRPQHPELPRSTVDVVAEDIPETSHYEDLGLEQPGLWQAFKEKCKNAFKKSGTKQNTVLPSDS
ncbi:hypothetical protein WJX72_006709 [[Myrmecia] bisecta]|uniref:Uncharacterized protein n=1 Tax=[Myrmecia] bisecta TaxID=41462 RepID=A0AAW1R7R7_9CHLO